MILSTNSVCTSAVKYILHSARHNKYSMFRCTVVVDKQLNVLKQVRKLHAVVRHTFSSGVMCSTSSGVMCSKE
jgi:hypothetical protein